MNLIIGSVTPSWFHGVDIVFETFSFIIAIFIAGMGYKAYRLSGRRRYLAFAGSFGLLALSFVARIGAALLVYLEVLRDFRMVASADIAAVEPTFLFGRFVYITTVFTAYLMLVAVAMRLEDKRVLALMFSLLGILAWTAHAYPSTVMFHLVNLLLLVFIVSHYIANYLRRKTQNTLVTLLAFLMILFESLLFLTSNFEPLLYIGAYIFRLVGYVFLAAALIRVIRS